MFEALAEEWESEGALTAARPRSSGTVTSPAVLLVEGDATVAAACRRALERSGCTVYVANGTFAALTILREEVPIDILITGLMLPRPNGRTLQRIARERRAGLKVIFVTGYNLPEDAIFGSVLRTPISATRLAQLVRQVWEGEPQ